ncbi:precorrin-2 C(20)-methyltransferase [Salinisphaera sp. Q1T1-3]|uniref:precorrin-2 C(20)-methyltransferase n=1 Tax=Salinisphaera sp. Q1T1-3 TaxID=2321229 RepID=UPI000E764D3D|nr:precorrin-2 C(20)-methyltransferase [Salinisphaera sp. Q1T1-3]RJS95110.1 precorrin-2 C(20)-methyltransferase [Salinisphaera sp. Q1T1-3]
MSGDAQTATLFGVGTGPGDPELLTVKAVNALARCPVVAYFCKTAGRGNALSTVADHLRADHIMLPMAYPVTTELPYDGQAYHDCIEAFFDESATAVATHIAAGRSVAVLSEGDPFFYGSFMHLFVRLHDRVPTEVIPGVPAMLAGAARLPRPIAMRDDVLSVIPGTLPDVELGEALAIAQAAVVMKVGRNLARIRAALDAIGATERAWYVERASQGRERVLPLSEVSDDRAPYFSMVLLPGTGKRL